MLKYILFFLFLPALLLEGCFRPPSERDIVVTEVTHFRISVGPEALSLPIFINYVDEGTIAHQAAMAESYFEKLSKIYDMKSYDLIGSRQVPSLVNPADLPAHPKSIYSFTDGKVGIEFDLISLYAEQAQYRFRMKSGTEPWREQILTIPVGQSCSVGVLSDTVKREGQLLSFATRWMRLDPTLSVTQAAAFLRGDSSADGVDRLTFVTKEERNCLAEVFGKSSVDSLAQAVPSDSSAKLTPDTPPEIEGGGIALGMAIKYPESAKADGFEGMVLVGMKVGSSGEPSELHIVKSARADVDSAAINALKSVRFKPALINGMPVAVNVVLPIDFRLDKK